MDRSDGTPRAGAKLGAGTTPFLIPWRPEPDAASTALPLRPWRGADGFLYSGLAFNLTFDLGALRLALPEEVIFGVAFNTRQHGPAPLGVAGPYDALHVAVSLTPPSVGLDFNPGAVYWKTADGRLYADGGAGGVNTFRRDAGWLNQSPAVRFNNSAYGSLADVLGRLEGLKTADDRTNRALTQARSFVKSALDRTLWDGNRQVRPIWGRLVFDLLAESAAELGIVAAQRDAVAPQAQDAVESILGVAEVLAEAAVGEAIISAGDPLRLGRAQEALDVAAGALPSAAIDELGNAWREAQLALR